MITLINKKLANRKGFTLIELLVVLAVLAIIALIAIPNFIGIQDQSKRKTDRSSADAIANALDLAIVAENITVTEGQQVATFDNTGTHADAAITNFTNYLKADYKVSSGDYTVTFKVVNGKVQHDAKTAIPDK